MSLEFNDAMYVKMEGFVGRRQIFGRASDVVDSDRVSPPATIHFGRAIPSPREPSFFEMEGPMASTTAASDSPTATTHGHDTHGSTR